MSRVTLRAGWVLVAVVVLLCSNVVRAQTDENPVADAGYSLHETEPHGESASRPPLTADEIKAVLDAPLKAPLQYAEQPLNEVINELQEQYQIPILFDQAALDEVAISPDTEVTINLGHISLRSALNLMLRQPGLEVLTYAVDDEVLLITTEEKANEKLSVEVYVVDDLIKDYPQQMGGDKNPYSSLAQVITSCVEYDTWKVNGSGEGAVQLIQPGILVVAQTRRVHEQVQDLLEKLRSAHKAIDQPAANTSGRGSF